MQFEMAPEIQQTAQPPKTNFFTTVGLKIKFGSPKAMSAPAQDYNSSRSNKPSTIADGVGDGDEDTDDDGLDDGTELVNDDVGHRDEDTDADGLDDGTELVNDGSGAGDCDDSDSDRCIKPGGRSSNDSDADGIDDGTNKTTPPTTKFYEDGKWFMMCNGATELDPISLSATYSEFQEWLAQCKNYGTGDVGDYPPVDEAYSQFTSRVNLTDAVETAQDYNAATPTKDDSFSESEKGLFQSASRVMEEQEAMRNAAVMAGMANQAGTIIKLGSITSKGKKALGLIQQNGENPLHTEAGEGENEIYEGEANNEDGDNESDNQYPTTEVKYDMQPSSYCVELSTMKISTDSQKAMRSRQNGDLNTDDTAMATSHNASRSNRSQGISNDGGDTGSGVDSTRIASATDYNSSRSNTTSSVDMSGGDTNGDLDSDSTRISNATDYNSSRSNTTSSVVGPDNDIGADSTDVAQATSHNASRSNRSQGISNDGGDTGGADSTRISNATDYNSSRSNTTSSIADLGGDLDGDGFPDLLENASLTMKKRKRPGRAKYGDITLKKSMNNGGDVDGDGLDDASGLNIELELGDPDSDDDGLMDAIESATYSISKRSARTGRTAMRNDQENPLAKESGWQEAPVSEVTPPGDVHQWTYKLNALSDDEDLPGDGTLTVIMTGGKVHFNVLFDSDTDEDGYGELLQNSSFSISKRSARTGRNPQSTRE